MASLMKFTSRAKSNWNHEDCAPANWLRRILLPIVFEI